MPRAMAAVTIGIYTAARLGLAAGFTDDVARLTGRPPIPMEQFVHDTLEAWLRAEEASATETATTAVVPTAPIAT